MKLCVFFSGVDLHIHLLVPIGGPHVVIDAGAQVSQLLENLGRQLYDLTAGLFHQGHAFVQTGVALLTGVLDCSLTNGHDQGLVSFAQTVIDHLAEQQVVRGGQVAGHNHVVLLLVNPVGINDLKGIFLGIDGALLKSHINFGESHRSGAGTQSFPDGNVQLVFHDTDLLAVHILGGLNLGIAGHLPHALVKEANQLEIVFGVFLFVEVENLFVIHGISELLGVSIEERKINDVQLRNKISGKGGGAQEEGYIAGLCGFTQLGVGSNIEVQRTPNLELRLNTEVNEALIRAEQPDIIIVACGAEPIIPPIPGLDRPIVHHVTDLFKKNISVGKKVVIIGGGLAGSEEGLGLAWEGHDVSIVEMKDGLAKDAPYIHWRHLISKLDESVHAYCSAKVLSVEEHGVKILDAQGQEQLLEADTVLVAAGMRATSEKYDGWHELAEEVIPVGDCRKASKILEAMRTGYCAGLTI